MAEEKKLTLRQRRFIEEYCKDFIGADAIRRSGFTGKYPGAAAINMLKNPAIKKAIKSRLDELSMSAEEALKRMTDMARGDLRPFLRIQGQTIGIDLDTVEASGYLHLIKKIKQNDVVVQGEVIRREYEIEIHDAKDALDKILKIHGKYAADKIDLTSSDGSMSPKNLDDWYNSKRGE